MSVTIVDKNFFPFLDKLKRANTLYHSKSVQNFVGNKSTIEEMNLGCSQMSYFAFWGNPKREIRHLLKSAEVQMAKPAAAWKWFALCPSDAQYVETEEREAGTSRTSSSSKDIVLSFSFQSLKNNFIIIWTFQMNLQPWIDSVMMNANSIIIRDNYIGKKITLCK